MHNPLRFRFALLLAQTSAWVPHPRHVFVFVVEPALSGVEAVGSCIVHAPQLNNNMFPLSMHAHNNASLKPLSLAFRRCFEGLRKPTEPSLHDAVAANPLVNAPRNRFHLRQFRHRSIVENDCGSRLVGL
jgi:hypothetical protein